MDLSDLWRTLSRQWAVAVLVAMTIGLLGAAAAFLPERTYRTAATVVIDLRTDEEAATIQQVNFLLPSLQQWVVSRRLVTDSAPLVPEVYRDQPVSIDAQIDQSVLYVGATAASPEVAQAWANAVTEQLIADRSGSGPLDLVLLDEAPLRIKPISPQVTPVLIAAFAVALIGAVFAALLADRIRHVFNARHAVRERLGATVLGEVPRLTRTERRTSVVRLMGGEFPQDDLISAFETIRIGIEFRLGHRTENTGNRISVISLDRQAGKSTISAGLSCAIGKMGREVVAVEADLRRPTLAEQLGAFRGHGLGDIAASGDESIVLQATKYPHLRVLSAGVPVGRPADVVATTLPSALNAIDRPGRMVIIDAPPLRGAPESAIVVSEARNVILVVASERVDLDALSEAVAQINDAGGILLGIVINRVSRRRIRRTAYRRFEGRAVDRHDVPLDIERGAPIR